MPTSDQTAPAPAPPPGPRMPDRVRLPVAVLVVAATLVVALLAIGLVVRVDAQRLPVGPALDPPAAPPAATTMTVSGRDVSLGELRLTLAGPPYGCVADVPNLPTGFEQLPLCSTTVHADYDGHGHDWVAATGIGLVDDSLVAPDDLARTTSAVFDAVLAFSYSADDRATLRKESSGPAKVPAPTGAAYTRQADVHVRVDGLPTPYDRLVVIVVRLKDGRHVAFFSDFPHDGGKDALAAVVASANSLSARG